MANKKILLIDGNSLIFRAYFASAYTGKILTTKNGTPTNAVYSFANMLTSLLSRNDFYDVKVAFDKGKHTFRHDKLEDYKAGRNATPPELIAQFPIVREMLDAAGIDWFEMENFEADDIIGAIDKYVEKNLDSTDVEILTSDKDMFQLISDKTKILIPVSGTSDLKVFGKEELFEKWSVSPEQVIDLKGIMGDNSDNLKGVPGIGEKGAIKLVQQFGTVEGIYEHIDEIKGATQTKLIDGKESAFLCKEVATIATDFQVDGLTFRSLSISINSFVEFLTKYEMYSLITRMQNRAEQINTEVKHEYKILEKWDSKYECKENNIYVEALDENYHKSKIIGFGISNEKGNFYINVKNEAVQLTLFDDELPTNHDDAIEAFFANPDLKKSTYDIKRTVTLLRNADYKFDYDSFDYDMMIASYVLDPNNKSNFPTHLRAASTEFNIEDDEFIYGKGMKRTENIDLDIKANYITKKAWLISQTKKLIIDQLKANDQFDLYERIDLPFAKILFEMEQNGVLIDQKELNSQTALVLDKLNGLEDDMRDLLADNIDDLFNFSSPKQVQTLLFETLNLKDPSKGSTGKDVLEKLIGEHPIVEMLLQYRKLSKLYSTYLKGFEKYIFNDKKVHTIYNQTLTNTGRLSSIEPNLQNISVHDTDQKEVRKIFITDQSSKFFSFDYSQVELRVLAQMAPEHQLIDIFANDGDIHEAAARRIFGLSDDAKVDAEMRRTAKTFNFGIIYGLSDYGLSQDLHISIGEAKMFIQSYYQSFPDILEFKTRTVEFAKESGYVLTMANRKRFINELRSENYMLRQFGERAAVNMPIQGTAADILKVAMINIAKELKLNSYKTKMVAQIHDEIIFEIPDSEQDIVPELIKTKMNSAFADMIKLIGKDINIDVKLKVSESNGMNWFDLK